MHVRALEHAAPHDDEGGDTHVLEEGEVSGVDVVAPQPRDVREGMRNLPKGVDLRPLQRYRVASRNNTLRIDNAVPLPERGQWAPTKAG